MALTREVTNLGTPEDMFLSGSNESALKGVGCTSYGNPNIDRGMSGGAALRSSFDTSIPMGPNGGLVGHQRGSSCGIDNPLNLGASSQVGGNYGSLEEGTASYGFHSADATQGVPAGAFSYPPITHKPQMSCMSGGKRVMVCKDPNKIVSYKQVHHFWSGICPGAVMIYNRYAKKNSKYLLPFIKDYTKAFCEELNALRAKTNASRKKHLAKYKHFMKNAEKNLHKMNKKAHNEHMMVYNRHLNKIKSLIQHSSTRKKMGNKKTKQTRTKRGKMGKTNKNKRHSKGKRHTRKMRGGLGYQQFNNNVPITQSYSLYRGNLPPGGALANPMPYQANPNTCNDVYNHYTRTNTEAPMRG